MTEQRQPQVAEGSTTRKRKMLGLILVFVGLGLFFPGIPILVLLHPAQLMKTWFLDLFANLIPVLIWGLPIIGLGLHARTHGRTILWALAGWFPLLGPLLALAAMRIDRELAEKGSRTIVRLTNALTVTAGIPLVVLAIMIPGYRTYTIKKWQHTARYSLEYLHGVQLRYLAEHQRFATFEEVGFVPSPFYTYRIDGSGNPGTVILATKGKVTPDNSIISAGSSAAPAAFTITATANLDFDATIDQWHITDSQPNPVHDVNDRKN